MLWYVLLKAAYSLVRVPAVIKVVAAAIAAAAVSIFLFKAPFPIWFKALFLFSGLAFYEYTVMERSYGVSMLLFFLFAAAYTAERRRPILCGLMLALAANAHVHSAMLAGLLLAVWIVDVLRGRERETTARTVIGISIGLAGIGLCALTILSARENVLRQNIAAHDLLTLISGTFHGVAWAFRGITGFEESFTSIRGSFGLSADTTQHLISTCLLVLPVVGLVRKNPVLAIAGLCGTLALSAAFVFVYAGYYRHQGTLVVFFVTLYWIAAKKTPAGGIESSARPRGVFRRCGALVPLILAGYTHTALATREFRTPLSSARELGNLLTSRADLREARLFSVPDFMLESVPYYAANDMTFLCGHQTLKYTDLSPRPRCELNLKDVVIAVQGAASGSRRPVILLIADSLETERGTVRSAYSSLSWDPQGLKLLRGSAEHLASFRTSSSDENYDIYLFRPPV